MHVIVGTAGHIDHGKTALVKALTGTDADRLPEEKERGITIDLGFAELELNDDRIGFVDVPGHERFVKNMLAGASGIDVVMLVIAADEGVMPQTREHFEICRLLGVRNGLIVLTKADLVDEEMVELAKLDASELVENSFLENAPIVTVSSKTGVGIDRLKDELALVFSRIKPKANEFVIRLPIDRTFSMKGFGAVVTGTLVSGKVETGKDLELLPGKTPVRIRGIQTHGKDADSAMAGQRTALNLSGIDHSEIKRGMVLSGVGQLEPGQIFDTKIELLKAASRALRSRQRVRVHLGTLEALARIEILNEGKTINPGESDYAQIRLEKPAVAVPGEKFVLRQYSPQITIAGGLVLDNDARKHRGRELSEVRKRLKTLQRSVEGEDTEQHLILSVKGQGKRGIDFARLQTKTGYTKSRIVKALERLVRESMIIKAGGLYVFTPHFEKLSSQLVTTIEEHHRREPLSEGLNRETLRETSARVEPEIFRAALESLEREGKIMVERDLVSSCSHVTKLSESEMALQEKLIDIYLTAKLQVPTLDNAIKEASADSSISFEQARKIFQLLVHEGKIVKVTPDLYFHQDEINALVERLQTRAKEDSDDRFITIPSFKEIAGVSRKYAIPLLEYFDSRKITRRAGDKRLIL